MLRRLLAASFALAACAQAAIIHVPGDQPTIQRGINAATAGDTVLVAAGTYHETFDFVGKDLVVKGQGGPTNTMVSGDSLSPVVTMNGGETPAAILEGFTITGGFGGIRIQNSAPTIASCRISENAGQKGGGVYCESASPDITQCAILRNSATAWGGGLYCDEDSAPTLVSCRIEGNDSVGYGGGLCAFGIPSSVVLTDCRVEGNVAGADGGGIYCYTGTLSNCEILGNSTGGDGGGAYLYSWGLMSIVQNCSFAGNTATHGGGGAYSNGDSLIVVNCTVSNNSAYSGGGLYLSGGSPSLTNCILWANTPDELNDGTPSVTYCNIQGDYPGEGNFGLDPRFVTYHGYEYLLHPRSPCVDAGDPTIEDGISDWHPKWPDFYQDGPRSDMGTYGGPGNVGWLP